MWAVYKKELRDYFYSPIGYVAIGLFLLIFSTFFFLTTIQSRSVDMGGLYFNTACYGLLVIVPLLTMRMFSEERKNGTEQLLLTSPRSITGIVFGKLLAAITVIVITLVIALTYSIILSFFQAPNITSVLVMSLGFVLLATAAISFGMFASCLTENQVISAVITIGFLLLPWFLPNINSKLRALDLINNYIKFPSAIISIIEITRLITFTAMFVLLTIIIMKRRKIVK